MPSCKNIHVIQLYHGSGSRELQLQHRSQTYAEWTELRYNALRLLRARKLDRAARLLELYPFEMWEGTNGFGDEFQVLFFSAPPEEYAAIEENMNHLDAGKGGWGDIADTIGELSSNYIRFIAAGVRLVTAPEPVAPPRLRVTSETVEHALSDAEHLLRSRGPVSAVDRAHTAFHAYLRELARDGGIEIPHDASIAQIFKILRQRHPRLTSSNEQIGKILSSLANVVDSINTIRNRSSLAHPNESLLPPSEAMLAINAVRALLHYLHEKTAG